MTQTAYPLSNSPILTESQWSSIAQNWLGTGVVKSQLNELSVYADSTGMQVKVQSGQAYLKGVFFQSDAEEALAISTADASNPRIDRVILRLDWATDSLKLAVLQGTPAASPTAPAVTQNTSRWEISLAQIAVGAGVTTIAAGNVTDERRFTKNASSIQSNFTSIVGQNGWAWPSSGYEQPQYLLDEMGFVHFKGVLGGGTTTRGTVIFTLPAGYRPSSVIFVSLVSWYVNAESSSVLYINPDGTVTCYDNVGNTVLPLNMIPAFKAFK